MNIWDLDPRRLLALQSFQELNLPRMIQIMGRNAVNVLLCPPFRFPGALFQLSGIERCNRATQELVLLFEQSSIALPRSIVSRFRQREPVRSRPRERNVAIAQQAAANDVLPV